MSCGLLGVSVPSCLFSVCEEDFYGELLSCALVLLVDGEYPA